MSAITPLHDDALHSRLDAAMAQVNQVLLGKPRQVKLAFTCLIAGGHLLLEDVPGVGKTTLAHALAASFALDFQRVQFTSDLLPSDIIGVSVYERETGQFRFHPGPIFTGLLLADEINRATPKTQSALLEAMAEGQVTVDGQTHTLPQPFFVVATQNPLDLAGTFPLPDSQLDRFMLRVSLDYPDAAAERALLTGSDRRDLLAQLSPKLDGPALSTLHRQAQAITASPALLDYLQALLAASRRHAEIRVGLSPRAGLALLNASRTWAMLSGRGHVLPEDIQALFVPLAGHRLVPARGANGDALARQLLAEVAVD
ncbi:MoxR-like ATPase [Dyella sp. SG562]|uniref:AAA family ATPase n=1 Tax=Dyella TaxID=231454 RepID=UPI0014234484|nr:MULTISPECIES: MoxR family ATPase [unclassified Dyella]MBT2116709.1 MoxR family ATPase [Dyella sp. LX-1]MBT2139111.1 MoxR family ATPase [Dyella sp. LX-66]NII75251.1 MoxR-like ATPase [Dyella sp. SG562]NKJ20542.1 MoxR-like ATPase [Dyella sp. SG609]